MKQMKKWWLAVLAALLVAGLLAGCGGGDEGAAAAAGGSAAEPEEEQVTPIYPLTGEVAPDKKATEARIISVKIENTPEARPQLGVVDADVVYESITEGGITRFNCLYQSTVPEEVGPVRSARDSDMSIVPEYNAFFFFSGANDLVWARLATTAINEMSHNSASDLYHRVDTRTAPHNLYLDIGETYETAAKMGYNPIELTPRTLEFDAYEFAEDGSASVVEYNTAGLQEAVEFEIPFSTATYNVQWAYADGGYTRSVQDKVQADEATEEPVRVQNVVVLWQDYVPAADIPGKGQTYNIDMTGSGDCCVYRGGVKILGRWQSDGETPPRFVDAEGNPIPLAIGKTWFEILPTGVEVVQTAPTDGAAEAAEDVGEAGEDAAEGDPALEEGAVSPQTPGEEVED
ncbi:MAG: DUF3048 domain-containing protein [Clostridiales Family XIII bacterium]|jgi:hypothetical protein|nr:DUF3048 domain-containing protein [Clostridiales Family XIII bacterium]